MRKKLIAGAAVLALLMSAPQARADDDIVVFGGEFEEEAPALKKKPEPIKELPPEETPAPIEEPPSQPEEPPEIFEQKPPLKPADSAEEPTQSQEPLSEDDDDNWGDKLVFDDLNALPEQVPAEEPQPIDKPASIEEPPPQPEESPEVFEQQPPLKPADSAEEPAQSQEPLSEDDDDNWGDKLVFDDLNALPEQVPAEEPQPIDKPAPIEQPVDEPFEPIEIEQPFQPVVEPKPVVIEPPTSQQPQPVIPPPQPVSTVEPTREISKPERQAEPQKKLKMLKPRFVKLAVDETYTYYLDKNSVQWKKMPYSSSEYIADVWIRMVERKAKPLAEDMAAYGEDNFNAEVSLAEEQGYQYTPDDLQVLSSQAYVLEHYYLRPKTNQIQFLCELEVFGRPQNAINERAYDYKNWENLVPGSVESVIYATVLKTIGKSKATERGHMTFIDMLEEYGRISLR